jgi:hypothetical protein
VDGEGKRRGEGSIFDGRGFTEGALSTFYLKDDAFLSCIQQ